MPLYDFQCVDGHTTERRVTSSDCSQTDCFTCGKPAIRSAINRVSIAGTFARDFYWTPEMTKAHEEALGYKHEAAAAAQDAAANGWRPSDGR